MSAQGSKNRKSRFGTVTPLKSGKYWVRATDPATGKRATVGTYATEKAARAALVEAEHRANNGERLASPSKPLTFGALAQIVADTRTDLAPGTQRNNASALRTSLAPFLTMRADRITVRHVDQWWNAHAERPVARRNAYFLLSSVYRWGMRWGLVSSSPCQRERAGADVARERPVFSTADFRAVAAHLEPEMARAAWVLYGAHLRIGELCGLEWRDWDAKTGTLRVERQITGDATSPTPPKTGRGKSVVVLEPAAQALAAQRAERPGVGTAAIFPGAHADRLRPRYFRDAWRVAAAAAGMLDFRVHDVRHVSLSAVARHASLAETMARGGHRTARAALRYQAASAARDAVIAKAASAELAAEA